MTKKFSDGSSTDEPTSKHGKQKRQHSANGYCLSCNAKLDHGSFCDDWCREDYEFEQEMRKAMGKPRK